MFIPAATALKNLVYRIIPTPGQAFHGSVTLTTFFSIFLIFSFLLPQLRSLCGTDLDSWSVVRGRQRSGDNRRRGAPPLASRCAGAVVAPVMFHNHVRWQTPYPCHNDGWVDRRASWATRPPVLRWRLTWVGFWSFWSIWSVRLRPQWETDHRTDPKHKQTSTRDSALHVMLRSHSNREETVLRCNVNRSIYTVPVKWLGTLSHWIENTRDSHNNHALSSSNAMLTWFTAC